MNSVKVAVLGASGYSGEELLRLLLAHPLARIVALTSRQYVGQSLGEVMPRFAGIPRASELVFCDSSVDALKASGAEIVFLALPHGLAAEFAVPLLEAGMRVIDLSADFRTKDAAVYEAFYGAAHPAPALLRQSVYGLPEWHRAEIAKARLVASPGCYPTSILVPLLPLLEAGVLESEGIHVSSMSGVSGAGRKADASLLYAECNESVRAYGIPLHRHLSEIEQELSLAAGKTVQIDFVPHLVPVTRGIHTTIQARLVKGASPDAVEACWHDAYAEEPFVRLLPEGLLPDTKRVTLTNFVDLAWRHDPRTGTVILLSAEDNLTKGASGQAVQSLNIMCGWPETTGLF